MPMYNYKCPACEIIFVELARYEERDTPWPCPKCETSSPRTWEQFVVSVSTPKTSASIPDIAAKGRFDKLRHKQAITKGISEARERGDKVGEKQLKKELKKL